MQIERKALAYRWDGPCVPRQSGLCILFSHSLNFSLCLFHPVCFRHTPAAREPLALLSISCLFSQYQIIPGVYLLLFFFFFVPFPASVCLLSSSFFHCLFALIITLIPLTFSSVRLPWNKLHHDNTHILDHILHHLDSCSLAQPLQFSMVLIITYSIMQFFSAISF